MNVGSYLRGKSAFTTHQNSQNSYGLLYGNIYGNIKYPPFLDEQNKTQLPIFQENCVILKKWKNIFRNP